MKKSLGKKRKEVTESQARELFGIYESFAEGEFSKIYPNEFFGYTKVVVEQPLLDNCVAVTDGKGNLKADLAKRDYERVPLTESVEEYFNREIKPFLDDAWLNRTMDKVGYEINFSKYFYKFTPLRALEEISIDLKMLDNEINKLSLKLAGE